MRRCFERSARSALLLAAAVAQGCASAPAKVAVASERMEIVPVGGDVFDFRIQVAAVLASRERARACVFELGDKRVAARVSPEGITAELPLVTGENLVKARCSLQGGR